MTVLDPIIRFLVDHKRSTFTLTQAIEGTNRPRRPVLRVLDKLAREGYLTEIKDEPIMPGLGENGPPRRNPTWRINKDKPVLERPRVKVQRRTLRDKMWQAMCNVLGRKFTVPDLQRLSGASRASAERYTRILERTGHVRRTGRTGRTVTWLLIKDVGAKRPKTSDKEAGV